MILIVLTVIILTLLLSVMTTTELEKPNLTESRALYDANNFAIYSSALTSYAQNNAVATNATINDTALTLPSGYVKGAWTNKIVDIGGKQVLLTYSTVTFPNNNGRNKDIVYYLESILEDSMTLGWTQNNTVMSNSYYNGTNFSENTGVTIPNTTALPNNTVVVFKFLN